MKATLDTINTTVGIRYIVMTYSTSREFKTMKGAERYMRENGYQRVMNLD